MLQTEVKISQVVIIITDNSIVDKWNLSFSLFDRE